MIVLRQDFHCNDVVNMRPSNLNLRARKHEIVREVEIKLHATNSQTRNDYIKVVDSLRSTSRVTFVFKDCVNFVNSLPSLRSLDSETSSQ